MIIKTKEYSLKFSDEEREISLLEDLVWVDRSNLICIAARPGMGKTSLTLHMALEYTKKCDKTIYIFSTDLCSMEIYERMIDSLAEIDTYHMRIRSFSAEDKDKITKASDSLKNMNIIIDDTTGLNERQIIDRLDAVDNLGLVIIDSLQYVNCSRKMELLAQESSIIARELRCFAKRKNIPVILTHKLNRKIEEREDKRPLLGDLREDGALAQDFDTIIFIYRDEYYNDISTDHNQAEIIIAKNRYGSVKTISLEWQRRYGKFSENKDRKNNENYHYQKQ
ncbi:MAG: DnaB-like helicase C-terminal domain-containing protein [Clostridia bacterium]|nr:DnaB-like helicase C-terminal domain-containing protein [Clostridia bacterium]